MKILLVIISVFVFTNCTAQSAFKRLPKPTQLKSMGMGSNILSSGSPNSPVAITAWRLTGPIAGFMYPQQQLVTGLGYGYQKLHWVESTQKYYADFSISGVAYLGGSLNTSNNPYNIMSVGISFGAVNQLVMVGPCWNFPNGSTKGSFGVVFNVSMPLN